MDNLLRARQLLADAQMYLLALTQQGAADTAPQVVDKLANALFHAMNHIESIDMRLRDLEDRK